MIHKQILKIEDSQHLTMPRSSVILSVGQQDNQLCIWYRFVDNDAFEKQLEFWVIGTGEKDECKDSYHLGTVPMDNGEVWHVFTPRVSPNLLVGRREPILR